MKILITGAAGFLGWHSRVRLGLVAGHEVVPVARADWDRLDELITNVDAVIHLAGVNRGTPEEVEDGNVALAQALVMALGAARQSPRLVFANSIHAGSDTPYGRGKARASKLIARAASDIGLQYVDVRLPNLFGEHGRPHYNSFVQTFIAAVITGRPVEVDDRPIGLLHVQRAAQALLEASTTDTPTVIEPPSTLVSVRSVFDQLRHFADLYVRGEIPPLPDDFAVDLFNAYRAALFPDHFPIKQPVRADHRGALVEVVRAHGGQGQMFASTTHPGVTRGEHFHLRKIERFVVLGGRARIQLRRLFHDDVITFDVAGDEPAMIDMPTMWAHNITNVGDEVLTTLFWANELFDPERPDTYPHPVAVATSEAVGV